MASIVRSGLAAVSAFLLAASAAVAEAPTTDVVVDATQAVSGKHKARASGAKGQCVAGSFTPSKDGASLSKSSLFTKPRAPVLARFSMGGGNPAIPDGTKGVTRGFALRIDPEGDASEFVFISAPMFGFKSPEQMVAGLQARAPQADGKADQEKIKAFTAANPETARQSAWLASKPVPASFAGVSYWGVHAFTLTDAASKATVAQLKFVPKTGDAGLTDDEANAKGKDFYVAELTERLVKGPAEFDLVAILGEAGDATDDATAAWPEGGPQDGRSRDRRHRQARKRRRLRRPDLRPDGSRQRRRRTGRRPDVRDPLAGLRRFGHASGGVIAGRASRGR